jgi:hypothetical protein
MNRFQFSTQHILLVTAFVAINCGVFVAYGRYTDAPRSRWLKVCWDAGVVAPLWIPSVFVAYAIGRRTFTAQLLVIFAIIQLLALLISWELAIPLWWLAQ